MEREVTDESPSRRLHVANRNWIPVQGVAAEDVEHIDPRQHPLQQPLPDSVGGPSHRRTQQIVARLSTDH